MVVATLPLLLERMHDAAAVAAHALSLSTAAMALASPSPSATPPFTLVYRILLLAVSNLFLLAFLASTSVKGQ